MDKKESRLRRCKKARSKMRELGAVRLSVHKTSKHIYAQILSPEGNVVLASASTLEKDIQSELKVTGNVEAAVLVGKHIAQRAGSKNIKNVAFDRSGFKYHGRIKALADSARESGLVF